MTMVKLSKSLGLSKEAIRRRKVNPTMKSINEVAGALCVEPHELISSGEGHTHLYDNVTGEWIGIVSNKYQRLYDESSGVFMGVVSSSYSKFYDQDTGEMLGFRKNKL